MSPENFIEIGVATIDHINMYPHVFTRDFIVRYLNESCVIEIELINSEFEEVGFLQYISYALVFFVFTNISNNT
jgi:hypothetical protein